MGLPNKKIYLIRHGETAWTLSGQHTGSTDLPLTKNGERQAELIGKKLKGHTFGAIFTSPLKRALHTCQKAGFSAHAHRDADLAEWNYGDYEGLTSLEICKQQANWTIFTCGAPHGESVADISERADRMLAKIQPISEDVALFSHGHFLRVLAARWLGLPAQEGRLFALLPASLSILGFEKTAPVLHLWNDICGLVEKE